MLKPKLKSILNQSDALSSYFESLLNDADDTDFEQDFVDDIDQDVAEQIEVQQQQHALEQWQQKRKETQAPLIRDKPAHEYEHKKLNTPNADRQILQNVELQQQPVSKPVIAPFDFLIPSQPLDLIEHSPDEQHSEQVVHDIEVLPREQDAPVAPSKQMVPVFIDSGVDDQTEGQVPQWAVGYFQCLMFKVAGMNFAAPLDKLSGILEWPETITHLPNQLPWFVGLTRNRGLNVQIVDLATIIRNSIKSDDFREVKDRARYIMLVDEGRWGIVSDTVADVITLNQEEVVWQHNAVYPWLLGTVKTEMCTLIDIEGFVFSLDPDAGH